MYRIILSLYVGVLILFSTYNTFAQTSTWLGTTSNQWEEASNWSNGIPSNTSHAIIGNAAFSPQITNPTVVQQLTIHSGMNLLIDGGELTVNTSTLNQGNVVLNGGNWLNQGNLQNEGSITINAGRTLSLAGQLANTGNIIGTATSSLVLSSTGTQNITGTGTLNLAQLVKNQGTLALNQDLTLSETLNIPALLSITLGTGTNLTLLQNLNLIGTLNANAATLRLEGTSNQTLQGNGTANLSALIFSKPTGTVNLDATLSIQQNFEIPTGVNLVLFENRTLNLANQLIVNGTFDNTANNTVINFNGTSNVVLGGNGLQNFQQLRISKTGAGSLTLASDITVNQDFIINSGNFNINSGHTLHLAGNFTNNGNDFIATAGSTVNLINNNDQTLGGTGQVRFHALNVSKTAGLLLINRNPIEVVQDFTLPAGVSFRIAAGQNFDVFNSFTNNGILLPNAGGVRFVGTGAASLSGTGTMEFRDIFISKTGLNNNVSINVPIRAFSWFIINNNAQVTLNASVSLGAAGGNTRMRNDGTIIFNHPTFTVEGTGNFSIQGNSQTVFDSFLITKTAGRVIFEQSAEIIQDLTLPNNITLELRANRTLRLQGNLTVNGVLDTASDNNAFWFVGNLDTQINGTNTIANFNNLRVAKNAGHTLTLNINTEYLNQIYVEANNTLRLASGNTILVQNNTNSLVFGTLSLGNNTQINYNNGNAILRIENTGLLINDVGSENLISGRLRIINGGGTCTVSQNSTLSLTGVYINVEGGAILNLEANANLVLHRHLQVNNSATYNLDPTAWIIFEGEQNSNIEGGGNILNLHNLRVNKTNARIDLRRRVALSQYLDLVAGNINSTDNNLLIFEHTATHSGGSAASYIEGPARKIGNTNFEFPLGKNNRFGKLSIQVNTAGATTDYFDVEYFGEFFANTSMNTPLTDVSDREFWRLERDGTTQVTVALYWEDDIAGGLGPIDINRPDLAVAQWNESTLAWESRGNGTANPITDFLESTANQDNFAAEKFWTLAYTGGDNPNWGASTWIGSVSSDWDNPNNWQPAIIPDETITAVIIGDRLLSGNFNPIKNTGAVAKVKNLILPRVIYPTSLPTTEKPVLNIANGFTLEIGDGTAGTGNVEVYGNIINFGTIQNTRDFNAFEEAVITNHGILSVGNRLELRNEAIVNNQTGATLSTGNRLFTYNNVIINNEGSITINNNLEQRNNSSFNNQATGTVEVGARMYLRDASTFTNHNTLNVNRQLDVVNNSTLTNHSNIATGAQNGQPGTLSINNNAQVHNTALANITLTENPASSVFMNNAATLNNDGLIVSTRQFELRANGVSVNNQGTIRWRQDFRNDGTFTGAGSIILDEGIANSRIYGTSPLLTHQFIINKTTGTIIQEKNTVWTSDVTVANTLTYTILPNLSNNAIQGNLTIEGVFELQDNAQISISGNLSNEGTINAGVGSVLRMQGASNALISGASPINLYRFVNEKTAAQTQINNLITLQEDLHNLSGALAINANFGINLRGNLLNEALLSSANDANITFQGNADSEILGNINPQFAQLTMDKTTGSRLILRQDIRISQALHLTSGLIDSGTSGLLILEENATSSQGNATSYVNGKLRKYVNGSDFVFPVGKGGRWARIAITDLANGSTGDFFEAEYFPVAFPDATVADLAIRSGLEHWTLDRSTGGSTEARVTLYWEDGAFSDITDIGIEDLRVAHYSNTPSPAWYDRGGITQGTVASGNITTAQRQNEFSPWTFGSLFGVNPLPVRLVSFEAKATAQQQTALTWKTASEENVSHFEVERSQEGITFYPILSKEAVGNSLTLQTYQASDTAPLQGLNYYRLKSIDFDGTFTYSEVVAVLFENQTFQLNRIYPNPVAQSTTVEMILPENSPYQLLIYDVQGKVVYQGEPESSNNALVSKQLDLGHLQAGTYILKVQSNQQSITKRLIKQ